MKSEARAWYAVAILMAANLSGFIDRLILALLAPTLEADLGLSKSEIGMLIGLPFALFYSIVGLPVARLADRSNRRNIISAGIALWSVMTAVCVFAGTFWRLLFARIGVGVGEATLQAPATSLIADLFSRERLATAMSVYSTGVFLGSGLAYFIGGVVVGLVAEQSSWTLPIVGTVRPWQTAFLLVGLPGLIIALLMLTVKEPPRRTVEAVAVPLSTVIAYMRSHARTFTCLIGGFTFSATVNYGIAIWLASFLVGKFGWAASRAGMVQGILTMTIGTIGVLVGGRVSDAMLRRGWLDGPMRVGIIGAFGMLVSATAYPFAPTATIAVIILIVVNFFAAFPWGAASAAAAESVPAAIRAQGAAFFYLILNLVSFAVGPWVVGVIADALSGGANALGASLAIVNVAGMTLAITLLAVGLPAYRRTVQERNLEHEVHRA